MILHVVIRSAVYFLVVTSQECIPGHLHFSYKFHLYFCKQEMRYCSEDAPRTGERNVNCNKKTTSENVVLNKMFHPDERAPSFIFKKIFTAIRWNIRPEIDIPSAIFCLNSQDAFFW